MQAHPLRWILLTSVGSAVDTPFASDGHLAQIPKPVKQSALLDAILRLFEKKAIAQSPAATSNTLPADLAQRHPLRILVAEDNPVNVKLITILLARMGYPVEVVGTGADKGKLSINWSARDKNLGNDPITLSYAEQPKGPWKTIADKLSNSGRFVWALPEQVPYQFYVRVEAVDRAGNIGEAITAELVKVDLATPKVKILNVEPGR